MLKYFADLFVKYVSGKDLVIVCEFVDISTYFI